MDATAAPHIHDTSLRRVRERDLLNWKVWLDVPVRRLRCSSCGIMTEKIDWLPERQRYTSTLSAWVESLVRLLPIKHVASLTGILLKTLITGDCCGKFMNRNGTVCAV